ncbi:MAG TPA: enolase C-terminal domain-like protein [Casimicrobiaceae bacterium]|jgi:L-alanine-DL-glutamate epimerase-like enolase superfamily enzyme|nr:enolase C-terminal domain-like protein [Casimicrobiaceae bacterium]
MRVDSIEARALAIPFRITFAHASAERRFMQSVWVEARSSHNTTGVGEGCPREYVTGEGLASALAFIARHRDEWCAAIDGVESLVARVQANRARIDANPAAWCAVELALLDCIGREASTSIEALLAMPPLDGTYRYTAVIGDGPVAAFDAQLARYVALGFRDFKIKLSGDAGRDRSKVRALSRAGVSPSSVRADANNRWKTPAEAIAHLAALDWTFFAIEEPLAAGDYAGMRDIARTLQVPIVLDESATRVCQLDGLGENPRHWIVNLRISKMGGLVRSLEIARRARDLGLRLIVGAHVGETSVLTRAALAIATFARDILVAQEGAFGTHLLERDAVAPCLMFGPGGVLHAPPAHPGLGLAMMEGS